MNQIIVYILIGVVIFFILFLTIRFILQMAFIRECPNCGRSISLAVTRECPDCGYVFLKNRHAKLNAAIAILVAAVAFFLYLDVHFFRSQTADYLAANPYLWRGEASVDGTELGVVSTEISGTLPEQEQSEPLESGNPIAGVFSDIIDGLRH